MSWLRRGVSGLLLLAGLLLSGCRFLPGSPAATPLLATSPAGSIQPVSPTPTLFLPPPTLAAPEPDLAEPDSGWELLRPGLERRVQQLPGEAGQVRERLYMLRIDPAGYQFNVAYHPGRPQMLQAWQAETGALVVMNGGYFTEEYLATGLIIVDGQPNGVSYDGFAGMLAITPAGPELRWLAQQPYDPAEPLLAGLQSFPLLVKPGGVLGFPDESGQAARRTVIAQDRAGRFLFLIAGYGAFTLHELSQFLTNGDLDLDIALNLDGGPSSGIVLADPAESVLPQAFVPAVITVQPRP
ncbi:MAG: phosphodiester glycosidase family protein [Ardenticatenaceae bacterium]|nr:phosphodiester glycosidase family protein [Anaerolineales bacterium]MCB8917274.1 phosphodiester glycosidase family protein [Ardenticatenaceae bacterium]